MRIIRYLFLLLSVIVLSCVFASRANAATMETNNEDEASTSGESQANSKTETLSIEQSQTVEQTSSSKIELSGTGTIDSGSSNTLGSTLDSPSEEKVTQDYSMTELVASSAILKQTEYVVKSSSNTQSLSYLTNIDTDSTITSSFETNLAAPVAINQSTPPRSNNGNMPISHDALVVLTQAIQPAVSSTGQFMSFVASNTTNTNILLVVILLMPTILMVSLVSGFLMRLRNQGFSGAARSAGVWFGNTLGFLYRELSVTLQSSLFNFSFKTNVNNLIGGNI